MPLGGRALLALGVANLVSRPPIIQTEFMAADVGKAVALTVAINQCLRPVRHRCSWRSTISGAGMSSYALAAIIQLAAALIAAAHDYRYRRGIGTAG